ncbi:hypothetical protein H311_03304, partial [Anncaliia algerae PRA109]
EKHMTKSRKYFLNVCYKYNFFNYNFSTYDSELDDVIGNFIDLNSYANNIGAFLKKVKYIYHTKQFKSVILGLEYILNIVTQFNDAIDKLNYGLLNLHSQLKFKNKEEIKNDEYRNRVFLLIIKLSFSSLQDIMKLFNENMLDSKEKIFVICEEWRQVSIRDKFYICYGEEYPGFEDSIEKYISFQIENSYELLEIHGDEMQNILDKSRDLNKSKQNRIEKTMKYFDFLHSFEIYRFKLDKYLSIYKDSDFYQSRIRYLEKKQKFLEYLEVKLNILEIIKGKMYSPNSNFKNIYDKINILFLLSLKYHFKSFVKYFEDKINEYLTRNSEEHEKMIEIIIKKLEISKTTAEMYLKCFLSNIYEFERVSSSTIKYFSIVSYFISIDSTAKYNALISVVKNLEECIRSLNSNGEDDSDVSIYVEYENMVEILLKKIYSKKFTSVEFYFNDD